MQANELSLDRSCFVMLLALFRLLKRTTIDFSVVVMLSRVVVASGQFRQWLQDNGSLHREHAISDNDLAADAAVDAVARCFSFFSCKAVTRNLFRERRCFLPPFPSFPFLPFLSFSPLSSRLEMAHQIQLRDSGERCQLPQRERTTFAVSRHVPFCYKQPTPECVCGRAPAANTVFAQVTQSRGNVSDGCKYRPISVKRNLKIKANVLVSECTVSCRVVA